MHVARGDLLVLGRGTCYYALPKGSFVAEAFFIDSVSFQQMLPWALQSRDAGIAMSFLLRHRGEAIMLRPNAADTRTLTAAFADLAHEAPDASPADFMLQTTGALLHALAAIERTILQRNKSSRPPREQVLTPRMHPAMGSRPEVLRVARAVRDHLDEPWSLARMAERVRLSPSRLSELFRNELGIAPINYLNTLRAQELAYLLMSTDLSVKAAARCVGWGDPSYAGRVFRRHFGASPTEYRRMIRRTDSR